MVETVAKALPFELLCYSQAVAAKWMLNRRGLASTLYFGVWSGAEPKHSIDAHAWIAVENRIIVGGAESKSCQVIAAFS